MNNIEEFIYNSGLSGSIDILDREFISDCLDEPERELEKLVFESKRISSDLYDFNNEITKMSEIYFHKIKEFSDNVKKYNDTLVSDGIWGDKAEDDDKRRERLGTFNAFVSKLDNIKTSLDAINIDLFKIEELRFQITFLERKCFLMELVLKEKSINNTKIACICEKISATDEKLNEAENSNSSFLFISLNNSKHISNYLKNLGKCVDPLKKSTKINIHDIRNLNLAVITALETSLH
ncbi:MAG: hypothetical protein U0M06_02055 [Clostridia bacterium]|nr:hypothetical protein [Clostridia bacterium]